MSNKKEHLKPTWKPPKKQIYFLGLYENVLNIDLNILPW